MRPFAALERFFERLFERPSARLFHARLQPIQLQRRVERAMENGRLSASDRVVVPNRYLVRLAPADLHGFGDFADSLELELADAALRFARAHRYAVADRPAVRLVKDEDVAQGDVRVEASFSDRLAVPEGAPPVEVPLPVRPAVRVRTPDDSAAPPPDAAPAPAPAPGSPRGIRDAGHPRANVAEPPLPSRVAHGIGADAASVPAPRRPRPGAPQPHHGLDAIDGTRTMIFEVPTVDEPVAVLREVSPDGSQRQLTLDGGPVTIGRATENNLVLNDSRVSRFHGRLVTRQGALVYSDLGSTNGSRVNGVEVDEVVLGAGDRLELGDTVLVVESVAGD